MHQPQHSMRLREALEARVGMLVPEGRGRIKHGALGDGVQCHSGPGTPHFSAARTVLWFPNTGGAVCVPCPVFSDCPVFPDWPGLILHVELFITYSFQGELFRTLPGPQCSSGPWPLTAGQPCAEPSSVTDSQLHAHRPALKRL